MFLFLHANGADKFPIIGRILNAGPLSPSPICGNGSSVGVGPPVAGWEDVDGAVLPPRPGHELREGRGQWDIGFWEKRGRKEEEEKPTQMWMGKLIISCRCRTLTHPRWERLRCLSKVI